MSANTHVVVWSLVAAALLVLTALYAAGPADPEQGIGFPEWD